MIGGAEEEGECYSPLHEKSPGAIFLSFHNMDTLKYKRILLKLSGEALAGTKGHGIDGGVLQSMAQAIGSVVGYGGEVGLVIGGGNLVRGVEVSQASNGGMNRAAGDAMGMLATVMNALAMQDALEKAGVKAVVMSAIRMEPICEFFDRRRALKLMGKGVVVLFAGGTGNPFFTTDSAAALRAVETECQVLIKATKVDGIYSADPYKDPTATRFPDISYAEVLRRGLAVMDTAAVALSQENQLPILVFQMTEENLVRAVRDGGIGTLVHP
jgi:uridylate kinase